MIDFLSNDPKHLREIYSGFPGETKTTIRGRLNENIGKSFKRIAKGVYLAIQGDAKALIIEGDAWSVIKEFEDCSIDAIITDSGYTCLNKHYNNGSRSSKKTSHGNNIGFKTKDIDEDLLSHMHRVLKPGGHFFSFLPADAKSTLDYNNRFIKISMEAGFEFNKRFIWDKQRIGMGYNGRNKYEQIIFLSKGERTMPYDLSIPDVLSHRSIDSDKKIHDAEKPVELIKDIMSFCSKKGDTILDPFAGSLSTARAGLGIGRNTISIEIDGEIIKSAIEKGNKNMSLTCFV